MREHWAVFLDLKVPDAQVQYDVDAVHDIEGVSDHVQDLLVVGASEHHVDGYEKGVEHQLQEGNQVPHHVDHAVLVHQLSAQVDQLSVHVVGFRSVRLSLIQHRVHLVYLSVHRRRQSLERHDVLVSFGHPHLNILLKLMIKYYQILSNNSLLKIYQLNISKSLYKILWLSLISDEISRSNRSH